jgi:hypothetical protein
MNRLTFGIIAEVVFGAIDVALMLPLNFDDLPLTHLTITRRR